MNKLLNARIAIAATAATFLALAWWSSVSPLAAACGFTVIVLALLLTPAPDGGGLAANRLHAEAPADTQAIDAVLAASPEATIVVNRRGTVVAFNVPAAELGPALTRGQAIWLALRNPDIVAAVRRACDAGEGGEVEYSERVPHDRWLKAFIVPFPYPRRDGSERFVMISVQDLSPLRRVEEMRADFVANASHELRTPLASVLGFIETLQGTARDDAPAREKFLGIMRTQAKRMARLIDDLLSLSRIELKANVRPGGEADLDGVVRQVIDSLQPLARERDVVIDVGEASGPLPVRGDRDELVRVFENLIENALRYGASGKRVEIRFGEERMDGETNVVVSVRDFGPGIAPEHLPRLTERFYRVDVVDSRAQGGTGLGLALVKHILNRHHGRLAIESTAGHGATFVVRLPKLADVPPPKTDTRVKSIS